MPDIADQSWAEKDDRNDEIAPFGWTDTMPGNTFQTGRMMMGAIKRFWDRSNPVYLTRGTGDNYTVSPDQAVNFIHLYEIYRVRADRANVGSTPTFKFSNTTARTIVKVSPSGYVALAANDICAGADYSLWYNGTNFVLSNPSESGVYQPLSANLTAWSAVNPSSFSTTAQIAAAYQPLASGLTSWAGVPRASGFDAFAATPSSANLAALLSDETGTGPNVFADSPTLTGTVAVPNSSFTLAKLANGTALSVPGVAGNAGAAYADITAGTDGFILRRSGTTLGFGTILSTSISDFSTAGNALIAAQVGVSVQAYDAQLSSLIRQNSQSAAYTLVLTDSGKQIYHPSADTTARTWTIPANASVAFAIGTAITFVNDNGAGVITIAITTDTMKLAGAGTTGSRTLAANGIATALKITATSWIISGTGLT